MLSLQRRGHTVVAWIRSPHRARAQLGEDVPLLSMETGDHELANVLRQCQAVITLAGEPLFGKGRSPSRNRTLVESRVGLTSRLVSAMGLAERSRKVLISSSAVSYYGDRVAEQLSEQSAPHTDFVAQLCRDWEDPAITAATDGTRVVCLRLGMVLGHGGRCPP